MKVELQVKRAVSRSAEYEIFKYLIFEKILPATAAEMPIGLPEEIAVVICVTAFAAVFVFLAASIVFLVVSET